MPFAVATVVTNKLRAMFADRIRTTPGTYAASPHWVGVGVGATGAARTAAVTDTVLSTEVETRGVGVESVATTSVANDTYRVVATVPVTADRAIDEFATFDQLASGGNMGVSGTQNVVNLKNGDSITWTIDVQQQ